MYDFLSITYIDSRKSFQSKAKNNVFVVQILLDMYKKLLSLLENILAMLGFSSFFLSFQYFLSSMKTFVTLPVSFSIIFDCTMQFTFPGFKVLCFTSIFFRNIISIFLTLKQMTYSYFIWPHGSCLMAVGGILCYSFCPLVIRFYLYIRS